MNFWRRRRVICLATAVVLIPIGVMWRMAPLHLPQFLYKYGGSVLWAAMVYWLVAGALVRWRPGMVAGAAALVAAGVEFSRLWHPAALDAFRVTLAGKLILGRFFSWRDIVAYWLAIAVCALLDRRLGRTKYGGSSLSGQDDNEIRKPKLPGPKGV